MKINLATPLLAIALSLMAANVYAQTHVLTVTGEVRSQPCTIMVDSIALGDVPLLQFVSSSQPEAKYQKDFNVNLQNCDISTLTTASLKFSGVTTGTGSTSVLALTNPAAADTAKGIGVQISTNDSQHGSVGKAVKFDGTESYGFSIASRKATYSFKATYIRAPGAASRSPGTANAGATVTLTYS